MALSTNTFQDMIYEDLTQISGLPSFVFLFFRFEAVIRVFIGESFPTDIRSIASGFSLILCATTISASGLLYPITVEYIGLHGTFWGYTAASLLTMVYCYFTLIDSRGKSLVDLEEYYDK